MGYRTVGELSHFDFAGSVIADFMFMPSSFQIVLNNVHILPENSTNRDIRTMRCNNLNLKIEEGRIARIVEEAYRVYDADMRPFKEVPDQILPKEEYETILSEFLECTVDGIEKKDSLYVAELCFDDHTYRLEIEGREDEESWEKYLSP